MKIDFFVLLFAFTLHAYRHTNRGSIERNDFIRPLAIDLNSMLISSSKSNITSFAHTFRAYLFIYIRFHVYNRRYRATIAIETFFRCRRRRRLEHHSSSTPTFHDFQSFCCLTSLFPFEKHKTRKYGIGRSIYNCILHII